MEPTLAALARLNRAVVMPTDSTVPTADMIAAILRFTSGTAKPVKRDDVRVLGQGQLSIVLGCADLAFVFPRSEFARDRLKREVEVLALIRPRVSAAVPEVAAAELGAPLGQAFVARRALPGVVVTSERLAVLDDAQVARIATETARFLRELHPLAGVAAGVVPTTASPRAFADELRAEVDRWLVRRMSSGQQVRAQAELDELAALPAVRPVLCHTDLGGNIVFDDVSRSVGFIDLGSVMVADPVLDLASVSVLGSRFTALLVEDYPMLSECLPRVAAVSQTFALQDALYGARQGDWAYVDDVLSGYRGDGR